MTTMNEPRLEKLMEELLKGMQVPLTALMEEGYKTGWNDACQLLLQGIDKIEEKIPLEQRTDTLRAAIQRTLK